MQKLNNYSYYKPSFEAGLTKRIKQDINNFLKNNPYTKNFTLKKLFTNESKLDILLRDTWNGK